MGGAFVVAACFDVLELIASRTLSPNTKGVFVEKKIVTLGLELLRLDPDNPRLPSSVQGGSQEELIAYMHGNGVLGELAQSIIDNGFFAHEPLIVVSDEGQETYTVVEGNRRCSTLKILLGDPDAEGLTFSSLDEIEAAELESLADVPCLVVDDASSVQSLIGYRHISGLKPWGAEAKGRYIYQAVEQFARSQGDQAGEDPFKVIGRRLGSNSQGVRGFYIAYSLLRFANDELEAGGSDGEGFINSVGEDDDDVDDGRYYFNSQYLADKRFGVLRRALNDANVQRFIGYVGTKKLYRNVVEQIEAVDSRHLIEFFSYLSPRDRQSVVLRDSRQLSLLGQVLANDDALGVLRRTGKLKNAAMHLSSSSIVDQVDECVFLMTLIDDSLTDLVDSLQSDELKACDESLLKIRRLCVKSRSLVQDSLLEMEDGDV